jgi:hypothetical protein
MVVRIEKPVMLVASECDRNMIITRLRTGSSPVDDILEHLPVRWRSIPQY